MPSNQAVQTTKRKKTTCAWIAIMAIAMLCGITRQTVHAQVTTSSMHGTVTDTSDSVVPDAKITTLNTATGIATVAMTNRTGYYIFTSLQPGGPYAVTIEANGFGKFEAKGITLIVNANWDLDARLKVGSNQQTVTVSATALQVETSNTQLEQIATAEQLEGIPLEGRDPSGLQKLQPGVVESSDRFGSYSSNGSQTPQNSFLLNGTDINDGPLQNEGIQVNPDALQEENIVTSTMNPEFARNSGTTVNQILKNGTNALHGSGFEFYRDTFMNNGNYFSQVRPVFHQNLYGGTLGGPLFKNKLFFFMAYQGMRNRTSQTVLQPTLNADQFNGIFSSDPNYANGLSPNGSPSTHQLPNGSTVTFSDSLSLNPMPFAIGNCPPRTTWAACFDNGGAGNATVDISKSSWNGLASKLIGTYVPQPNDGASNYNFNALSSAASDQAILRIDYTPSSKDTIWASAVVQSNPSYNELSFGGGSFPGFGQVASSHFKIFSASFTHTFSANALNELRGGYYRLNYPSVIPSKPTAPASLGFSINSQLPQSGVPYMNIGSYFNLGNSFEGPQPRLDTNLTYADNFTWVRGNHSLKFGGSFEQFRVHNPFGYLNNGSYTFNGGGQYSSGDPLIDFVLGIPDSYAQTNDGFIDAVAVELYAYAQDNWKASSDLTINYGIAWDAEEPNQNRQDNGLGIVCWQNSSATSKVFPGGPPGLLYPGDPRCNAAGGPTTHYNHYAPRIGFAWSPSSGNSKIFGPQSTHHLSVRGGFGVYYNRDQEEQSLQNLADPPLFYTSHGAADFGGSPSFANPYADAAGNGVESNPFPFTPPAAGAAVNWPIFNELGLSSFSPSYSVPYTYNFNLNIQRAISGTMVAQIGYVGSLSHRLTSWVEGDPITPAGHAACLANPMCASNPQLVHLLFPQYTAQPATVPGSVGVLGNGTPWYTSIGNQTTDSSSNYNSFQASLIKAPSHGLQFTAAYTYSHALDDGSGYESITGGDTGYGNAGRVHNYVHGFEYLNYGSSDFDARHRFATSYVYTVPVAGFLKNHPILRETIAGWGISGVTALQTGFPIGISNGTQNSLWCDAFSYFGCPDVPVTSSFHVARYNPRSKPTSTGALQYFDTTSFSPEPLGTFGNTARNFFHGPGFNYTNLSLTKNVHFGNDSRRFVQLRMEAFNAFNHANFASPNGNLTNPNFGRITSVIQSADGNGDPSPGRAVQLAGKFYF